MSDLASLQLVVDTTSLTTANRRVDDFVKKVASLETALDRIIKKNQEITKSFNDVAQVLVQGSAQLKAMEASTKSSTQTMEAADKVAKRYAAQLEKIATNGAAAAQALKQIPAGLPSGIPGAGGGAAGGQGGGSNSLRSFMTYGSGGLNAGLAMSGGPAAAVAVLAGGALLSGLKSVTEEVIGLTGKILEMNMAWDKVQSTLLAATGSHARAKVEMQYVFELSQKLGVPLEQAAASYAKIASAAGYTVEGNRAARSGFEGVETAARVLGLSASKTQTVMDSLTRMLSRGYVTSMDLSRQFSTSIPGAFRIAAQSMGVTEGQLKQLLKTGNVDAIEFLDKFGQKLKENFSGGLVDATANLESFVNRIQNQFLSIGKTLGEGFGLKEGAVEALKGVYDALVTVNKALDDFAKTDAGIEIKAAFIIVGQVIGEAARQVGEFIKSLLGAHGPLEDAGSWIVAAVVTIKTMIVSLYNLGASWVHTGEALAAGATGDWAGAAKAIADIQQNTDNIAKEFDRAGDTVLNYAAKIQELKRAHEEAAKGLDEHRKKNAELTKEQENEIKKREQMLHQMEEEIKLRTALYNSGNFKDADSSLKNYKKFIDDGLVKYNTESGAFEKGAGKNGVAVSDDQFQRAMQLGQGNDFLDKMKEDAIQAKKAMEEFGSEMTRLYDQIFKRSGDNVEKFEKEFIVLNGLFQSGRIDAGEYAKGLNYLYQTYTEAGKAAVEHEKSLDRVVNKYSQREHDVAALRNEIDLLTEAEKRGMVTEKTLTDARADINLKTIEGLKEGYAFVQREMKKSEDLFIDFAFKGKASFKDFVASVLEDLARLIFELTVVKPLMDSLKSSIGSNSSGGWLGAVVSTVSAVAGGSSGGADAGAMTTSAAPSIVQAQAAQFAQAEASKKPTPGGGGISVQVNVDARGNVDTSVQGTGQPSELDKDTWKRISEMVGQKAYEIIYRETRTGGVIDRKVKA